MAFSLKNHENRNFSKNFRTTATYRILMIGTALESLEAALSINLVLENIRPHFQLIFERFEEVIKTFLKKIHSSSIVPQI